MCRFFSGGLLRALLQRASHAPWLLHGLRPPDTSRVLALDADAAAELKLGTSKPGVQSEGGIQRKLSLTDDQPCAKSAAAAAVSSAGKPDKSSGDKRKDHQHHHSPKRDSQKGSKDRHHSPKKEKKRTCVCVLLLLLNRAVKL